MKYRYLILLIIAWCNALAQPVVHSGNFPIAGTVLNYYQAAFPKAMDIQKGENQVWDFSTMQLSFIDNVKFVDANSTSKFNSFPNATIAFEAPEGSGNYTYLDISDEHFKYLGFVSNSLEVPVVGHYDNDWLMYKFPLRYRDQSSDNFSSTSTVIYNGDTVYNFFKADYSYKVDGFGMLITPYKTYTNTLRIYSLITGRDSSVHVGLKDTTIVNSYNTVKVAWISSDSKNMTDLVSTQNMTDFYFQYMDQSTPTKNITVKSGEINLYPDPATNFVNLEISGFTSGPVTVKVYDNLGNVVKNYQLSYTYINFLNVQLPISDLQAGFYHINILSGSRHWTTRFVKQ